MGVQRETLPIVKGVGLDIIYCTAGQFLPLFGGFSDLLRGILEQRLTSLGYLFQLTNWQLNWNVLKPVVSQACQAGKVKGTPDETALCKSSSCVMTMQVFKDEKVIEGLDGYYGICFSTDCRTCFLLEESSFVGSTCYSIHVTVYPCRICRTGHSLQWKRSQLASFAIVPKSTQVFQDEVNTYEILQWCEASWIATLGRDICGEQQVIIG